MIVVPVVYHEEAKSRDREVGMEDELDRIERDRDDFVDRRESKSLGRKGQREGSPD